MSVEPLPCYEIAAREDGTSLFCTMLRELGPDACDGVFVPLLMLRARRALACCCYQLREQMNATLLHAPMLQVRADDATWDNIWYVSRRLVSVPTAAPPVMPLQSLRVEGECHLPEMALAQYRQLRRLKVGELGVPAALFFGAAVAHCEATLRLSDGLTLRTLDGMRNSPGTVVDSSPGRAPGSFHHYNERAKRVDCKRIILPPASSPSDVAVLLGALSLNKNFLAMSGPSERILTESRAAAESGI
jgi:hypothetical protein